MLCYSNQIKRTLLNTGSKDCPSRGREIHPAIEKSWWAPALHNKDAVKGEYAGIFFFSLGHTVFWSLNAARNHQSRTLCLSSCRDSGYSPLGNVCNSSIWMGNRHWIHFEITGPALPIALISVSKRYFLLPLIKANNNWQSGNNFWPTQCFVACRRSYYHLPLPFWFWDKYNHYHHWLAHLPGGWHTCKRMESD